jgi:hypothetical protein
METTFGPDYEERLDKKRINKQMDTIRDYMLEKWIDGFWITLKEISDWTEIPEASVSAQLRHLRKTRFGGYVVNKRRRGQLWEYQVSRPTDGNGQTSLF